MLSRLLVTSESNLQYVDRAFGVHISEIAIVKKPPTTKKYKWKAREVYALGGGSVIDTAKMIAGNKPCYAIPTTASGAAVTSWAVVWYKNRKESVRCRKPILIEAWRNFDIDLPDNVAEETYYDCLAHIYDSRNSRKRTHESRLYCDIAECFLRDWKIHHHIWDLIEAGNFAGRAIEITGTNFYHALSYVLTTENGLSHGEALKECFLLTPKYDWQYIIQQAKKYKKFHERITG